MAPWSRIPFRFILKSLFKKHFRTRPYLVGQLSLLINLPLYINVNQFLLARVQLCMELFRKIGALSILECEEGVDLNQAEDAALPYICVAVINHINEVITLLHELVDYLMVVLLPQVALQLGFLSHLGEYYRSHSGCHGLKNGL